MNKSRKFNILIVMNIIVFCIAFTTREFQNDTFYIVKLGDYIIHNGFELMDPFSFVGSLTYTYPHWLYDVVLYYVYYYFGYNGVYVSNIMFFIILVLSIYYVSKKIVKNEFICGFSSIMSIFILSGFVTARSQLISMILFIWEVYFILKLLECGRVRYIIYLFLICLLLANIHATIWPMYFILFLPFIFEELIFFIKNKNFNKKFKRVKLGIDGTINKISISHSPYFKLLLFTFVFSLFIGIFSPSKICYTYVFRIMLGNSQSYISEHAPLVVSENLYFIIMFLLLFSLLIFTRIKIKLSNLCMIFGLGMMALSSGRHISLFFLIASIFIWELCSEFISASEDKSLDIIVSIICNKYIYVFYIVIILFCGSFKFIENYDIEFIDKEEYPVDAVKFIKENLDFDDLRMFNDYNFGSYLLFNEIPVFIDSRSDLYMDEFNDLEYDIFDDFINIPVNYEEKFDYYDINYILEYSDSVLSLILYKDDNYDVIYEDDYFVLFEKTS